MRIVISGIPIDVQKKNIKNMHLQVKPPDGHVVISAPSSVEFSNFVGILIQWDFTFRYSVRCWFFSFGGVIIIFFIIIYRIDTICDTLQRI